MSDRLTQEPASFIDQAMFGASGHPNSGEFNFITDDPSKEPDRYLSVQQTTKFGMGSVLVGAWETLSNSLPLIPDFSAETYFKGTEFGDFYTKNKDQARTVADLGLFIVPGMGGLNLARSTGIAARTLKGSGVSDKWIRRIFASSDETSTLLGSLEARALTQAKNTASVDWTITTGPEWWRKVAKFRGGLTGQKVSDAIKENIGFELGVYAAMNQSDTLYPDDWGAIDHLMFQVPLPAAAAGVEFLYIRRQMANIAEKAGEVGFTKALGPNSDLFVGVSRPGVRDISLSQDQHILTEMEKVKSSAVGELASAELDQLYTNLNRHASQIKVDRNEQIKLMGKDVPWKGVVKKTDLSDAHTKTVSDFLDAKPLDFLGVGSLQNISTTGKAGSEFYASRNAKLNSLDKEIAELREAIAKTPDNKLANTEDTQKLFNLRQQRDELQELTPIVVEPHGVVASARDRSTIFQDYAHPTNDIRIVRGDKLDEGNQQIWLGSQNKEIRGTTISLKDLEPKFGDITYSSRKFAGVEVGTTWDKYKPAKEASEEFKFEGEFNLDNLNKALVDDETFTRLLGSQNLEQRTALWAGYERTAKFLEDKIKAGTLETAIKIDPQRHYLFADLALDLQRRLGPEAFSKHIGLPEGFNTDKLRLTSLAGKYREWSVWMDVMDGKFARGRGSKAKKELAKELDMSLTDLRHYLNLPMAEPGSSSAVEKLFLALRTQGDTDFTKAVGKETNLNTFLAQSAFGAEPVGPLTATQPLEITGKMLDYGMKNSKPVLAVYRKPPEPNQFTYKALMDQAAQQQLNRFALMQSADQNNAVLQKLIYEELIGTDMFQAAKQVGSLGNGSQRGQTFIGQAIGQAGTNKINLGESQALQGADLVNAIIEQKVKPIITRFVNESGYSDAASALRTNPAALQNFNEYIHTMRAGWDVLPEPQNLNNFMSFKLDPKSARNKRLWKEHFGEELADDADKFLPAPTKTSPDNPNYKPLALQSLAFDAAVSTRNLNDRVYAEMNQLNKVLGRSPIRYREWHVPSINLQKKHISLIRDGSPEGKLLYVATGDTPTQLREQVDGALKIYQSRGQNVIEQSIIERENLAQIEDEIFSRLLNFTDPLAQTAGLKGTLKGPVIPTGTQPIEDIQKTFEGLFQSIVRRNTLLMFEPQVNQVKALDTAVEATARTTTKGATPTKKWLNLIHGATSLDAKEGVTKAYAGVEDFFDKVLLGTQSAFKAVPGTNEKEIKFYQNYAKEMGAFNPYSNAMDFAQRTVPVDVPVTFKKLTNELNHLTSTLSLRLFELGHPVLNITSLASTMPAVTKALRRMEGESREAWIKRIGPFASITANGDEAIFSATKMLTSSAHEIWNKKITVDGKEVLLHKWASEQGFFHQIVNDMRETFVRPHQTKTRRKVEQLIDTMSKPSDMSESLARSIAFMNGWQVGEALGLKGHKNLGSFAHKFANDTVGDYRPGNRPKIFRGAVGMPLGLFTTFMWNYNERLLKYIENKNARAFYTQMLTQGALFGMESVPGYSQYVNFFANNYDGTSNPVTGIRNRFGDDVADWWNYGTLSNLPKLFGAEDGLALFTRGDAGLKLTPTLFNPTEAPSVQTITKIKEAFAKTTSQLKVNGISPEQIAQISAQYSLSRPYKGAMELYFGEAIDSKDRIINDDTRTSMSIIARVLGMKTLSEAKNAEGRYALGTARFARAERLDQLRDGVRFNLREGRYKGAKGGELLADQMRQYFDNGGTPEGFKMFLRNNIIASNFDRNTADLIKSLSSVNTVKDVEDAKILFWSQIPSSAEDYRNE